MPSKHPRINTVLEPPLYKAVKRLADRDRVSLSQSVRDLVRDALELLEGAALKELVTERRNNRAPSIPHGEVAPCPAHRAISKHLRRPVLSGEDQPARRAVRQGADRVPHGGHQSTSRIDWSIFGGPRTLDVASYAQVP
jgi:hypothetical protein